MARLNDEATMNHSPRIAHRDGVTFPTDRGSSYRGQHLRGCHFEVGCGFDPFSWPVAITFTYVSPASMTKILTRWTSLWSFTTQFGRIGFVIA